jgi:hypothetical protein
MRKSSIPLAASQEPIRLTVIQMVKIPLAIAVALGRDSRLHDLAQFLHLVTSIQPDLIVRPIGQADLIRRSESIHPELIPGMNGSLQTLIRRGYVMVLPSDTYTINPAWIEWRTADGKPALSLKARIAIGLLTTI